MIFLVRRVLLVEFGQRWLRKLLIDQLPQQFARIARPAIVGRPFPAIDAIRFFEKVGRNVLKIREMFEKNVSAKNLLKFVMAPKFLIACSIANQHYNGDFIQSFEKPDSTCVLLIAVLGSFH